MRRQKKELGVKSSAIISRKGAPTYNRFGGSSDSPRGRAVTVSISSTAKPKVSKENQAKAKDDSVMRPVTSPQRVPDVDKKTTPVVSPDPATTIDDAPAKSPPPVNSPVISPEPVTDEPSSKSSPPPETSPEPVTTTEEAPVKSPPPIQSPPTVKSPPPSSSTHDEPDVGKKKTGQPAANKQPSTKQLSSAKTSSEKAEFQGFQLRKTGLSVNDKGRNNKYKVFPLFHIHCNYYKCYRRPAPAQNEHHPLQPLAILPQIPTRQPRLIPQQEIQQKELQCHLSLQNNLVMSQVTLLPH